MIDIPIDPQLLTSSDRTAQTSSVAAKSGPAISTKQTSSEYDVGKNVVQLSEEESENAVYLIELVTGTSDDSESLMAQTSETEREDLLESLEDLQLTSRDPHPSIARQSSSLTTFRESTSSETTQQQTLAQRSLKSLLVPG